MINNGIAVAADPRIEVLASILVPTAMQSLLVPTVSVAEIVPYRELKRVDRAPSWLLGNALWRERQVPVMSLEQLCGESTPDINSQSRIVVFNNTGVSDQLPFLAILATGIPKLIQVSAEDLSTSSHPARPFENLRVNFLGDEVVIPEISSLEQMWLDWKQDS